MISDIRAVAEFLLLSAALRIATWLASLIGAELPAPIRVARVRWN